MATPRSPRDLFGDSEALIRALSLPPPTGDITVGSGLPSPEEQRRLFQKKGIDALRAQKVAEELRGVPAKTPSEATFVPISKDKPGDKLTVSPRFDQIAGRARRLGREARQAPEKLDEALDPIESAGIQKAATFGAEQRAAEKAQEKTEEIQITIDSLRENRRKAAEKFKEKVADADLRLQFAKLNKSPEELRAMQEIVETGRRADGSKATPEERERMARQLKEGSEIDPTRMLEGWRLVVGVIAAALGGFSGINMIEQLNTIIDRDITRQKDAFEKRRKEKKNLINSYRINRDAGLDEEESLLKTKADLWNAVAKFGDQMGAKRASIEARTEADRIRADLAKHVASNAVRNELSAINAELSAEQASFQNSLNIIKDRTATDEQLEALKDPEARRLLRENIREMRQLIEFREVQGSETAVLSEVGEAIKGVVGKGDVGVRSKMESLGASLTTRTAALTGQGALQKHDREVVEQMIGDPTGFGPQIARMRIVLDGWERLAKRAGIKVPKIRGEDVTQ